MTQRKRDGDGKWEEQESGGLKVQQVKLGADPLFRAAAKSDFRGELEATAPHEASKLKANETIKTHKSVTCIWAFYIARHEKSPEPCHFKN